MEKDSGSWFHHQHSSQQLHNLNSISSQFDLGEQNTVPTYPNPSSDVFPTNGVSTLVPIYIPPQTKAGQSIESHNCVSSSPCFHQAFDHVLNSASRKSLPPGPNENCDSYKFTCGGSGSSQRKFLVFDQSRDQNTLFFSSRVEDPVHCWTSCNLPGTFNLSRDNLANKREIAHSFDPFWPDYEESNGHDASEMREDTEELNALLCSDDNYSTDGDETSTGHSPSTMRGNDMHKWPGESVDKIASSAELTKRQKVSSGVCALPALVDTAQFVKPNKHEDDAESICSDGNNRIMGKKRSREEEIHEIVHVLQRIIPGGKGKDAVVILDEALHYLVSLKAEAEAMGLAL